MPGSMLGMPGAIPGMPGALRNSGAGRIGSRRVVTALGHTLSRNAEGHTVDVRSEARVCVRVRVRNGLRLLACPRFPWCYPRFCRSIGIQGLGETGLGLGLGLGLGGGLGLGLGLGIGLGLGGMHCSPEWQTMKM